MSPSQHGMARPQVADGGTASNMEGSCEYIELAVADSRQGVVLQLGGWARCLQLITIKTFHVAKQRVSLGPGLILWYDLSNCDG